MEDISPQQVFVAVKKKLTKESWMPLNKQLLEILVCPQCHGKVYFDEKLSGIICDQCKLLYEVKDDIPVMLVEEAKKLSWFSNKILRIAQPMVT